MTQQLIRLLDQLAKIAPEVCRKSGLPPDDYYKIGEYIFFLSYDGDFVATSRDHKRERPNFTGRPALAWLWDAIEQAIEARGWPYTMGWDYDEYDLDLFTDNAKYNAISKSNPAEALLTAFVAALEGER